MKLRNFLLTGAAATAVAAACSTEADAASAYAGVFGGASFLTNHTMKGNQTTHSTSQTNTYLWSKQSVDAKFKTGFVVGGNFGIDWKNGLRTELEIAMRQNTSQHRVHLKTAAGYGFRHSFETGSSGSTTTVEKGRRTTTTRDENVAAHINMRAYSLMANAWYDFDWLGSDLVPYVGGGVGMAMVQVDGKLDGISLIGTNDTVFAWQVGAGISYPLTQHTKISLDYRYFSAGGAHLRLEPGFNGGDIGEDFNAHEVLIGLRFDL